MLSWLHYAPERGNDRQRSVENLIGYMYEKGRLNRFGLGRGIDRKAGVEG